jgi:hypothetical protein
MYVIKLICRECNYPCELEYRTDFIQNLPKGCMNNLTQCKWEIVEVLRKVEL